MKTLEEMRLYKRNWSRKRYGSTDESIRNSATWKGRRAELLALSILDGSIDMNNEVMNNPFDIEWKGNRIDVKSCELYKRKSRRGKTDAKCGSWWVFNKNKNDADYYFCICLVEGEPKKYYMIPLCDFNKGITIGHVSKKFDKYLINNIV